MRTLLSVNNYYYSRAGAETVFLEQNRMFERLGWKVVPFSMQHPRNLATPWSEFFVDEIELGTPYSLGEKLVRLPRIIYSLQARQNLGKLLDVIHPDVCHAHNIYHHISPSILGLLRASGVPTVMTLHDLKIACPAYSMITHDGICERCRGGRLHNVVRHRCIKGSFTLSTIVFAEALLHRLIGTYRRHVNLFLVPSQFYIDKLVDWGMPREIFRHVPNFVDGQRFEPRFETGNSMLYFGRLAKEKGLHNLILAVAAAGCSLEIAGTGPELKSLTKLASQVGADVKFLGFLAGPKLHDAIRAARAIVLPSEWYENAPMSILEAYALGKPVIGAQIGGIPELIRVNETGFQFPSGDVRALTDILRHVRNMSESEIVRMGRRGREMVDTEFTASIYTSRVLAVYRELGISGHVKQTHHPATGNFR
jgi:glycosyltransferase involved in cell wall biosynthesis